MPNDKLLPRDPRTVEEMIPVRQAEIAARKAPRCTANGRHGAMRPVPLESQTYERMYCGVWYECAHAGCTGNSHWLSRELAAYHGEPYVVSEGQYETWNGTEWMPMPAVEFDAYWQARKAS